MRKFTIAAIAVLSIAGSGAVYAQFHRPWMEHFRHVRMNPEDRAAFVDARIAAVHAGVAEKPNADQEKLWPPVEAAVRDFAKIRIDRANARMNAGLGDAARRPPSPKSGPPPARARRRMARPPPPLKKIADAADPLYKTLDEGQKRRLAVLTPPRHRSAAAGPAPRDFERGGAARWRAAVDRYRPRPF